MNMLANLLEQPILRTDISGMPLEWIDYQQAASFYHLGRVVYTHGRRLFTLHGGICADSGQRSVLDVHSIIATAGNTAVLRKARANYTPPLSNTALFRRDANLCLYCGQTFAKQDLSRDHIVPTSRGGKDVWNNVITACKRCNHHKRDRTPEQAGMQLLAIPFTPTHAEYVYLQGRRILADQMAFLKSHFPRTSPLRSRPCDLAS